MVQCEVGKRFPDTRYFSGEGATVRFNEASFDVILSLNAIGQDEIKEFSTSTLNYGIFCRREVSFLILDFQGFECDSSFNIFLLAAENAKTWLSNEGNLVNIFLVDQSSGIIMAMRTISVAQRIMNELRVQLADQLTYYSSAKEVETEIEKNRQGF